MKSYGERLVKRKLRQVNVTVTSPLSLEAVDHVLHSYYNQIPQVPEEVGDVRIYNTGDCVVERSATPQTVEATKRSKRRKVSQSSLVCDVVRPTTHIVSIPQPTYDNVESAATGELGNSSNPGPNSLDSSVDAQTGSNRGPTSATRTDSSPTSDLPLFPRGNCITTRADSSPNSDLPSFPRGNYLVLPTVSQLPPNVEGVAAVPLHVSTVNTYEICHLIITDH